MVVWAKLFYIQVDPFTWFGINPRDSLEEWERGVFLDVRGDGMGWSWERRSREAVKCAIDNGPRT